MSARLAIVAVPDKPKIVIDPDLLWEMGYRSFTRSQVTDLLDEIYDTLELRAGIRLTEGLDSNQLATFERIIDSQDEARALQWLQSNVPSYRSIVQSEFDYIIGSLRRAATLRKSATDANDEDVAGTNAR